MRSLKLIIRIVALAVLVALVWSVLFVGLECYSPGGQSPTPADEVSRTISGLTGYARDQVSTFLTLPEWYIVYNTEEYGRHLGSQPPSRFPYLGSIRQYWRYYGAACGATRGVYPFSAPNHLMLAVIGSSFSFENALKGLYENSIGRLTEWIAGHDTPEDVFAQAVAAEYGAFMHTVPWYDFPFLSKLVALWTETPFWGRHLIRKWERRAALSGEYGLKAIYGWLIGLGTHASYGNEDITIHAWIENAPDEVFADGTVKRRKDLGHRASIVSIPRYEAFTSRALLLLAQGVRFVDIAGNDHIVLTVLTPTSAASDDVGGVVIFREPLLTDPATTRVAINVPVRSLHAIVEALQRGGSTIEHLYDY